MQNFAAAFYKSRVWQDCRAAYFKSAGGLCEECLARGLYKAGEIVHHKQPLTPQNIHDASIALSWDNLQLLCRDCHGKKHRTARRYKVDEMGNVII